MAFGLDSLAGVVQKGFSSLGVVATPDVLRNDVLMREVAQTIYDLLPFPIRLAVKMSVGQDGFERFVLGTRDRMLDSGLSDLSRIAPEQLRSLVAQGLASVPGLDRLVDLKGATAAPANAQGAHVPPPVSAKIWYLLRGETQLGPWSDPEFLTYAEKGELRHGDHVWREGFADWIAVRDLPAVAVSVQAARRPAVAESRR